jgi:uncharacterized metal-binding protein YceD (DUF177 family)
MRLDVTRFLENPGKRFPLDVSLPVEGGEPLPAGVCFCGGIHVAGEAFAQLGTLYVQARIQAEVERPCGRCLSPIRVGIDRAESFEFEILAASSSVDLVPQVLAVVLASLDPHPLCQPGCRGLCLVCGVDLNEDPNHTCRGSREERRRLGDFLPS